MWRRVAGPEVQARMMQLTYGQDTRRSRVIRVFVYRVLKLLEEAVDTHEVTLVSELGEWHGKGAVRVAILVRSRNTIVVTSITVATRVASEHWLDSVVISSEARTQVMVLIGINLPPLHITKEVIEHVVATLAGLAHAGISKLCRLWDLVVDGTVGGLGVVLVLSVTVDLVVVVTIVVIE